MGRGVLRRQQATACLAGTLSGMESRLASEGRRHPYKLSDDHNDATLRLELDSGGRTSGCGCCRLEAVRRTRPRRRSRQRYITIKQSSLRLLEEAGLPIFRCEEEPSEPVLGD